MKIKILLSLVLSGLAAHAAGITLDPLDGSVGGSPGQSVGWGFTVVSDATQWISFITSFPIVESNPSVGFYTDFIGAEGGPADFVLAPGSPDWVQAFDPLAQTGLGVYSIDPGAIVGSLDGGTIRVLYSAYSQDPNTCDSCSGTTGFFDVPFQVNVVAPDNGPSDPGTPEPATPLLVASGIVLLVMVSRISWGPANSRFQLRS